MSVTKLRAYVCALFALVLCVATAAAETVNCTAITSLPATITVQGVYCLTGDLSTSSLFTTAIQITTNNVILDLNGFKLGGLAAGPGTVAIGVGASNHHNITIKNGTIRGFKSAISLVGSGGAGHVVEDIRVDQNTQVGINLEGSGNIVRNNQVVATGGTTALGADADGFGIHVGGTGPRVLNNDVITVTKQGNGTAYGILLEDVTGGLVVNNRITQADKGIQYGGPSTGKYRDNLTFDVTTPFTGGTAVGTND